MGTKAPLSVFTGQNAQIRAVSLSHGVIRPNMIDAVDFTPKLSSKRVPEFDNPVDALTYVTFDGGSGRLSYLRSNQGLIDALIMDADPLADVVVVNPANMSKFQTFANLKGLDGKVKGCYLLSDCRISGNPFTSTTKDAAKETLDFEVINAIKASGVGLLYTRIRSSVGAVGAPAQPALATSTTGGSLAPSVYYVRLTAITASGETNGSNEAAIIVPTGTSTNKVTVTIPTVVGPVTGYNVYASDRSNGERLVASGISAATYDILVLPSTTAATVPNVDTTGAYQASNDKVFPGSSPFEITLDKAAYKVPQTGLDYALVLKNGEVVASADNPATMDTFLISAAGDKFSINAAPADADVWEVLTFYIPS